MTSKQKTLGTSHRTCTACGGRFTTWQGDDETMCNPCIIASFDDPDGAAAAEAHTATAISNAAAEQASAEGITGLHWDNLGSGAGA